MFRCFFLGPDDHFVGGRLRSPRKTRPSRKPEGCCGPAKSVGRPGLRCGGGQNDLQLSPTAATIRPSPIIRAIGPRSTRERRVPTRREAADAFAARLAPTLSEMRGRKLSLHLMRPSSPRRRSEPPGWRLDGYFRPERPCPVRGFGGGVNNPGAGGGRGAGSGIGRGGIVRDGLD